MYNNLIRLGSVRLTSRITSKSFMATNYVSAYSNNIGRSITITDNILLYIVMHHNNNIRGTRSLTAVVRYAVYRNKWKKKKKNRCRDKNSYQLGRLGHSAVVV